MYLKNICLENVGPISKLDLALPFNLEGSPQPTIIVGENGTGKSIILSFIVNALLNAKQLFYDDSEVTKGKVYKLRSPSYIKSGSNFYSAKLLFEEDIEFIEWQLDRNRSDFEKYCKSSNFSGDLTKISLNQFSFIDTNVINKQEEVKILLDRNTILFFPANRFEEPAWLNIDNLAPDYTELKKIEGYSNRRLMVSSALKEIQNWLWDIIYDNALYKDANTNNILYQIGNFLQLVFDTDKPLRLSPGTRHNRTISLIKNEEVYIPNIFHLSTGESLLLSLFCSILRDYDLTSQPIKSTQDIRGIVIIDEIDKHLHTKLQVKSLPKLIKFFPNIQFIATALSPLFILGMEKELTSKGLDFKIIDMPDGNEISAELFTEFEQSYIHFQNTKKYKSDLDNAILTSKKAIVFVEGDYDIRYIKKSAELLNKAEILENFDFKDGDGFGSLDKIWKLANTKLAESLNNKIILLYDCDTNKNEEQKSLIYKRIIPFEEESYIKKGIENLFPNSTVEKAICYKDSFIDTITVSKKLRGQDIVEPQKYEVNKDEKGNLCNWLCENGTIEDFKNFDKIFQILEQILRERTH